MFFLLLAAGFSLTPARASLLEQAERALDESIPQVAIQKLRIFLAASNLPQADRSRASLKLSEALLLAGEAETALTTIEPFSGSDAQVEARLLRADILVALRRWREALPLYRELARTEGAPLAARLGEAETLYAFGDAAESIRVLEALVRDGSAPVVARLRLASRYVEAGRLRDARALLKRLPPLTLADEQWKRYIEARLLLADGHAAPALAAFEEIGRSPQHLSEDLLVGATLGIVEAGVVLHGYEAVDKVLEAFISRYPHSSQLELIFERLDHVYSQQENPHESELHKWAQKQPPRCAALAAFYVARLQMREGKREKAMQSFTRFMETYPAHPFVSEALVRQANLHAAAGAFVEAERALLAAGRRVTSESLRAEIELRTGLMNYEQGDFLNAGTWFDLAANRSPALRPTALFNAALAALRQGNTGRYLERYRDLSTAWPESPWRGELALEHALQQARRGDEQAADSIEIFLQHFPTSPRKSEAQLARAELSLARGETSSAARYQRVVNEVPPSPELSDQAQYLGIFLADTPDAGDDAAAIERALAFIRERPQSPLIPDVRMKLGQLYFRANDFPNAETQLTTTARESPGSPHAEAALFLAGQAARKTINPTAVQRALDLFDEVVRREGPLKLHARQQQAIIQSGLDQDEAAIKLYDIILSAQPAPEPELRYAALVGKGDNLVKLGRNDPTKLEKALGIYDELAAIPEAPAVWRNQALYKKAKALEQLQRTADALAAYYDVLDGEQNSAAGDGPPGGRDYFWYYKAGFDAARLFEAQAQWPSAIGIYEKVARLEGPRSAEAKARMKQLRLEHFIPWE